MRLVRQLYGDCPVADFDSLKVLALRQEMSRDDRVILLGEDIGVNGGVFRVTEGLQKQFGAERVVELSRQYFA